MFDEATIKTDLPVGSVVIAMSCDREVQGLIFDSAIRFFLVDNYSTVYTDWVFYGPLSIFCRVLSSEEALSLCYKRSSNCIMFLIVIMNVHTMQYCAILPKASYILSDCHKLHTSLGRPHKRPHYAMLRTPA